MMSEDVKEVSLGAFLALIWRQRFLILLCTVLAGAAGCFYAWRSPAVYEADASLLLPSMGASPLPSAEEQSGARMIGGMGSASPLKMFRAVLESERTLTYVAQHSGQSIRDIQKMTRLEDESGANTITLKVTNADPKLALRLSTLYLQALQHVNNQLNLPFSGAQVTYLENRLRLQTEELKQAEARLLTFTQRSGMHGGMHLADIGGAMGGAAGSLSLPADPTSSALTPDLPTSPGASSPELGGSYATQLNSTKLKLVRINHQIEDIREQYRRAQKMGEELPADYPIGQPWRQKLANLKQTLKVAEQTFGPDAPRVVQLQGEIEATRQKMNSEVAREVETVENGVDPQIADLISERDTLETTHSLLQRFLRNAPSRNMRFEDLMSDVVMLKEIVGALRMRYEEALQLQARDPNRWEVLDKPFVTNYGKPVNKGYVRWSVLAGLLGAFVGTGIAIRRANRIQPPLV